MNLPNVQCNAVLPMDGCLYVLIELCSHLLSREFQ